MTVESATYINGLNAANPSGTDPKSEGDDHLRLIKTTVKATFPNITGAVTGTHTAINSAAAGTFNTLTTAGSLGVGTNLSVGTHLDTVGDTNVGGVLTTVGNAGIGIASPPSTLTVYKATNPVVRLLTSTTGTTVTDGLTVEIGSSNNGYLWNYENADLVLGTNNVERMRMSPLGVIDCNAAINVSTSISCNTYITAGTDLTVGGTVTVGGNCSVAGNSSTTGNVSIGGTLGTGGSITGSSSISAVTSITSGTFVASGTYVQATTNLIAGNAITAGTTVNATTGMTMGNSAQAGATVLDYYLEGSWTPSVASSSGSVTYTARGGTYTRIGNRILAQCYVEGTNTGGAGFLRVSLPVNADTSLQGGLCGASCGNGVALVTAGPVGASVMANVPLGGDGSVVKLTFHTVAETTLADLSASGDTTFTIYLNLQYKAA